MPSSTTATGKVSLISKSLKVSKRTRKVSVGVSCPRTNGLCEGRLNLIRRGKTIARTNFVVRGGRSGNASVTLSKKAYKALKKSQSVKVDVFSRDLAGNASARARASRSRSRTEQHAAPRPRLPVPGGGAAAVSGLPPPPTG